MYEAGLVFVAVVQFLGRYDRISPLSHTIPSLSRILRMVLQASVRTLDTPAYDTMSRPRGSVKIKGTRHVGGMQEKETITREEGG